MTTRPEAAAPRPASHLLSGAASSLVSLVVPIVAMPLYLRLLGAESFGVLGFVLALQAAVLALDAGLAVSVTRLVARSELGREALDAALLRALSRGVWWVAPVLCGLLALLAPALAGGWLKLGALPPSQAVEALLLAAVAIGVRWPMALYQGMLVGRQRLGELAALTSFFTVLTAVVGVALCVWHPDLRVLMAWMAASAVLHVLCARVLALRDVPAGALAAWPQVRGFLRQSAAAGALGVIGLLLMQVDKVLLSRLLPVDQFGYYILASMVAGSLYALVVPVFNLLFPQLARLGDAPPAALESAYRDGSLLLAALLFPIALAMGCFGDSILLLWTRDAAAAHAGAPVLLLLALGNALHGVMFAPYALKMAGCQSRLALVIGMCVLVASLPLLLWATLRWGSTGAAGAWLGLHACYLLAGSTLTHRRLLPSVGARWLLLDVGVPLAVSAAIVGGLEWATRVLGWGAPQRVAMAALAVVACWVPLGLGSARVRTSLASVVRRFL